MKRNLCLVVSNLTGGGAQRVVSNLSFRFSASYNLYLLLHDASRIDYPFEGEVIDLKTPVPKAILKKVLNFFIRIYRLIRIRQKLKPLAVISFMESSNFVNLLTGKSGKTVISVRNYKSKQGGSLLGKLFSVLIRRLYDKSDLIVAASEGIKDDLINKFALKEEKVKVIYNPYDIVYIEEKKSELLDEEWKEIFMLTPVFITVGSLSRQKGQWHLIRAFKKIIKMFPDAKLVILGEGALRPYLEKLVDDLGLNGQVFMPGFVDNPFKYLNRSAVFVMPSLYEGFPNALVEAMASGVPVISADCPSGPREILAPGSDYFKTAEELEKDKYGLLCPPLSGVFYEAAEALSREEEILAAAVISLYNDQKLYDHYASKSLERARDFEAKKIARQWVQLIEQ